MGILVACACAFSLRFGRYGTPWAFRQKPWSLRGALEKIPFFFTFPSTLAWLRVFLCVRACRHVRL
jgi:hypothetical protein